MTPDDSARTPLSDASSRTRRSRRAGPRLQRGSLAVAALTVGLVCAGTTLAPAQAAPAPAGRVSALAPASDPSAPVVVQDPTSDPVQVGQEITLTSVATGDPTPTVQWSWTKDFKTWTDVPDATGPTYSFTATRDDDGRSYVARYTNSEGSAETFPVFITILETPIRIVSGPQDTSVRAGNDAIFTVEATGDPAPEVEWMVKPAGERYFDSIEGANSPSLTVPAPTKALNGAQYKARLSTVGETVETDPATLTVTGQEPGVPRDLVARQTGVGEVTLTWTDPASHGDSELSTFETTFSGGQFGGGDSVPSTAHTKTFTGLGTGRYTFGVAAANLAGPGPRATSGSLLVLGAAPSLVPSGGELVYGQRLAFTGLAKPGSTVVVERALPGAAFRTLATVTASSTGSFRVPSSTPSSTAAYRARAVGGQPGDAGTVTVARRVTVVATRTATRTYSLHGATSPAAANQLVTVYAAKGAGDPRRIGTDRTDRRGAWSLKYTFPSTGTWTVSAVSSATRAFVEGHGSTRTAVR